MAEDFKAKGNKAFSSGQFQEAIEQFTKAIELDPQNHVLYSNRSASYASLKDFDKALEDALKTTSIAPTWAKGYSRLGAAYHGLNNLEKAKEAYADGLKQDPNNAQIQKAVQDLEASSAGPSFGNMFGQVLNNDIWSKIATNPKLSPYLADASYTSKINMLIQNPNLAMSFMDDPRIMNTLLAVMGIQLPEESTSARPSSPPREAPSSPPAPPPAPTKPEKSPEELTKEAMLEEKEKGNAAYKKRDFKEALLHYDRAWEMSEEKEIPILTNKAAVHFEMGEYDKCIELCQTAVEKGREVYADFKLIARALARIGAAYYQLKDLDASITYYKRSLTEHRTADTLTRLNEVEREKKRLEKEAYFNPELSEQARERGNALFKEQKYAEAVKEYTEAINRNEKEPKAYSNRAACYHKLGALQEALKDCETCIGLDPNFAKAYIRKAAVQFMKHEYTECLETCELAKKADVDQKHSDEIAEQISKCYQKMYSDNAGQSREEIMKKAMQDPEIQQILSDPVMNQILMQMQEDPNALRAHMANPTIAAKIRKLATSGIISVR